MKHIVILAAPGDSVSPNVEVFFGEKPGGEGWQPAFENIGESDCSIVLKPGAGIYARRTPDPEVT